MVARPRVYSNICTDRGGGRQSVKPRSPLVLLFTKRVGHVQQNLVCLSYVGFYYPLLEKAKRPNIIPKFVEKQKNTNYEIICIILYAQQ